MVEQKLLEDTYARLKEHYGGDRVVIEPNLSTQTSVYPDIGVFKSPEHTEIFLLVECSSLRTPHRRSRDFEKIKNSLLETQAQYGALIGPEVDFVFSTNKYGYLTYGDFPNADEKIPVRREIQSQQELRFLIEVGRAKVREGTLNSHSEAADLDILFALQLIIEARRSDIQLTDSPTDQVLDELQQRVSARHKVYTVYDEFEPTTLKTVEFIWRLFAGYSIRETPDQYLEPLFNLGLDSMSGDEYSTPIAIADEMVKLVQLEEDEAVWDPAAGRGTILTRATATGERGVGIELNQDVARLATTYIDIFGRDIDIHAGNFLSLDLDEEFSEPVETIIIDPPFGEEVSETSVPYFGGDDSVKSEDAFIAKSLSVLAEGGTMTVAVPVSFLHRQQSQWIRETMLNDFRLDSIIQVVEGPLYRSTSIDVSFITITKADAESDPSVQYKLIEDLDEPAEALSDAVSEITSGTAYTISQADLDESFNIKIILQERRIREQLNQDFNEVTTLNEIAELTSGNLPYEAVELEEPGSDDLRYLRVRDIREPIKTSNPEFVSPDPHMFKDYDRVVADESSVLLASRDEKVTTHIPPSPVAPAMEWVVIQFDSPEEALVYEAFLQSSYGKEQIEARQTGRGTSRLNVQDVRKLIVPGFEKSGINQRAEVIQEHRDTLDQLEQEKQRLAQQREQLTGDLDDLLTKGESDE